MTETTKDSILAQIEQQMADTGLSQRKLAKQLSISEAQLSNIRNRQWGKVSDSMWNKLRAALGMGGAEWKLIQTNNFALIHEVCSEAQSNNQMVGIVGAPGFGKTKALQAYARQNSNVGYVLCDFLMTQKVFLEAVANSFGIDTGGTRIEIMERICSRMNEAGNALLILDDLGKVNDRIYKIIQLFFDRTEGNAGIVVAGVHSLRNYLEKCAHRDKVGFRELLSRIEYWQELGGPQRSEVKGLCDMYGIQDKDAVRYITRVSGNFRILRSLITNARRAAGGEHITLDLLESIKINRAS